MGRTRTVANMMTEGIGEGMRGFRRGVASIPLLLLVPVTILAAMLMAPLGLVLAVLVWLARHSWNYERELAELYGPESAELAEFSQPSDH